MFYSLTKLTARWMTRQDFPFKRKLYFNLFKTNSMNPDHVLRSEPRQFASVPLMGRNAFLVLADVQRMSM